MIFPCQTANYSHFMTNSFKPNYFILLYSSLGLILTDFFTIIFSLTNGWI